MCVSSQCIVLKRLDETNTIQNPVSADRYSVDYYIYYFYIFTFTRPWKVRRENYQMADRVSEKEREGRRRHL